jgi:hypothetical protein
VKLAGAEGWLPADKDFKNAKLKGADLSGCDLSDFDLSNADLQSANLSEANLQNTKMQDAKMQDARLPPWSSGLLKGVKLAGKLQLLSSVVIGGVTGTNAEMVNGIYEPTVEVYNDKLLFQKRGTPYVWLRFDASNRWWIVSSTADKDEKANKGWCHCSDQNLDDPTRAVTWKVFNASSWEDQVDIKCVELLSSVVIAGVTGTHAERVNGIYEPTVEVYNGKLLFQKRGMPDLWLRFDASNRFWIVSSTADKDAKTNKGWCHCKDENLDDPKRAVAWKVFNGSSWPDEVGVKCVELLSSVVIGGVTGTHAERVNGIYEPTVEVYNGKRLFQKRGMPDLWLRFDASNRWWIVSNTADKDEKTNKGWCHCSDQNLDHPKRAVSWKIWNGSSWEDQVDAKCVESRPATLPVPGSNRDLFRNLKVGQPVVFALTAPRALTLQRVTLRNLYGDGNGGKIEERCAKAMEVQTGPSATGPWTSVVKFTSRQTTQEQTFAAAPDAPLLAGFVHVLVHDTHGGDAVVISMALEGEAHIWLD